MCCCGDDAVDEDKLILCCAACCINFGLYPACGALGVSGKAGICCCNVECCFKIGAPCLMPLGCVGIKCCENNGCALINGQCQALFLVCSCAVPCNDEVPCAVSIAGLTVYPKVGCCMKQQVLKESVQRS